MRLIVTRPEADAAALALQLEAAGHDVILAPLLGIRPVAKLEVPERDYQAILITFGMGVPLVLMSITTVTPARRVYRYVFG